MKKTLKWQVAQKAELQWWENYLKGKDVDGYHTWKKAYWQTILDHIQKSCPITDGLSVLDAGCGPAGIFMNLPNCKVDALDPLLAHYEKKLPHFKQENYPYVTFYSMPLEQFNPGQKYDIVFCLNAINHVADIKGCYNLLANLVKDGGKIVVTIDAHNVQFFKHLFRIIPGDILHPHQFDLIEYEAFLTSRNFVILDSKQLKKEFLFNHYLQVGQKKEQSIEPIYQK